jgi:hypothetical protein
MSLLIPSLVPALEAALAAWRESRVLRLPPGDHTALRHELQRLLISRELILDYLREVRDRQPNAEDVPRLTEEQLDNALDRGLGALPDDALASLLLDPVQLSALHYTIIAEPSEVWQQVQAHEVNALLGSDPMPAPATLAAATRAAAARSEPTPAASWKWWPILAVVALLGVFVLAYRDIPRGSLASIDWWAGLQRWALVYGLFGAVLPLAILATALRHRGWITSGQVLGLVGLGLLLSLGGWGAAEIPQAQYRRKLDNLFLGHRWVTYDPPGFNPYPETARQPTEDEIRKDLEVLRDEKNGGGFDALITFHAIGTCARIPALAKEVGFRKVIMGIAIRNENGQILDPADQIKAAIAAAADVDAYILGHNPPTQIDIPQLAAWMSQVRNATGKPVSTTAPLSYYLGERGQDWREIGDFYAPDVHGSWMYGASPYRVFEELRQSLRDVAALPRDKPVLLKMVSLPSAGAPDLSEDAQAEFYTWLTRDFFLPPGVYLSYFNGFDLPWKAHAAHPREWSKPEQYTGLFHADRRPKKAVEVVRQGFPVQNRP